MINADKVIERKRYLQATRSDLTGVEFAIVAIVEAVNAELVLHQKVQDELPQPDPPQEWPEWDKTAQGQRAWFASISKDQYNQARSAVEFVRRVKEAISHDMNVPAESMTGVAVMKWLKELGL